MVRNLGAPDYRLCCERQPSSGVNTATYIGIPLGEVRSSGHHGPCNLGANGQEYGGGANPCYISLMVVPTTIPAPSRPQHKFVPCSTVTRTE